MTANENVIKNIANEITRNCHAENVTVDPEFVMYYIELFFLNPKYAKIFTKTLNRQSLEYFVNECVQMITHGVTSVNTLKSQYLMQSNYDKLPNLINKHLDAIDQCLKPLVNEILECDPQDDDEDSFLKLLRKISIYIILCSGLGDPGYIVTLKEGMAALESVFSLEDLKVFVTLPRPEKLSQLTELMQVVSGVRLFNRDCKKGGEGIPDIPFNIVDAGKGCLASLSNALIATMQRVNSLTSAIHDIVTIQEETGNIILDIPGDGELKECDYKDVFELLAFNRQYEIFVRKLLADVELMVESGTRCVDRVRLAYEELHNAVKYKAAVPVATVFPLFSKLWSVWRAMQNIMFILSTINRMMTNIGAIQDQMKMPFSLLEKMLRDKKVVSDSERTAVKINMADRLWLGSLKNYLSTESFAPDDKYIQYLGFCALCLTVGALMPSNTKIGLIKSKGRRYGFCSVKMAARFSKDPQRYVNEVLEFARNNPYLINLLNISEDVVSVMHISNLVTRVEPKIQLLDKDIQTDAHPIDEYIDKDYSWNMWEWKRRACQWANIVKCQTHSTQTNYSHLRSEIHCQTVEPRNKCLQTKKDAWVNTNANNYFIWGLRGQIGYGQHYMDLKETNSPDKKKAARTNVCACPCYKRNASS